MKKRFFIDASLLVIGSSLLTVLVSTLHFIASQNIDEGHSLLLFLGYLTDFFNVIYMFIGYATIIYAFFKFGFYEGVMSYLIFCAAFVPYLIYQSITWNIFAESSFDTTVEGSEALSSTLLGVNYSIGQGVINQILPALLIAFIACKVIKANKDFPKKFISWKNRLQRSSIISCLSLAGINILTFFFTSILPELIDMKFVMTASYFADFIVSILLTFLELIVFYIVIGYIVFMLSYKFYEYRLEKANK